MPRPIRCPQCHSPSYRHIQGDKHQCNHCGSTVLIPDTPPPASMPEPPRAKLKNLIIILAILLAAAWLLEIMWAA